MSRSTATTLAATVLAAAAALTACGSSSGGSAAAGSGQTPTGSAPASSAGADGTNAGSTGGSACDLLTAADVSSIVGAPFDEGKLESNQPSTPFGAYTVCSWTKTGYPLTTVRVSVWEKAGAYDAAKGTGDEETNTVGEKSYVGSLASVYAVVNGHTLFAQYYDTDGSDEQNTPISTAVAKKAAGKL